MTRNVFVGLLLALFFLIPVVVAQSQPQPVVVFENEACGHCSMYLSELKAFLESKGFSFVEKSMINELSARSEWIAFHQQKEIPLEMQGHLTTIISPNLVLEGHVPIRLVEQVLEESGPVPSSLVVIFQDEMLDEELLSSYMVLANGTVTQYSIEKNVSDWTQVPSNVAPLTGASLTGLVGLSGFLAGIHPCTISVLLLLLAFLFTLRQDRLTTIKMGTGYIVGVFLAYLLIGVGLLGVVSFGSPHAAAQIAGVLVIILGLFNLARFFGVGVPSLSLVGKVKPQIVDLLKKNSLLAAFLVGIVVGICSFGCTAGIYFSVLGLLATNFWQGLPLLVLYNIMFILPLIVVLALVSHPKWVGKVQDWQQRNNRWIDLATAVFLLVAGVWLLVLIGGM